jgi:dihydrolipoamide dehydrogenase
LIEKGEIGGVCLNWGCIPTKTLLKSAKVYEEIIDSEKYGIDIKDKSKVSINWIKMQERKDKVVKQLTGGVKTLLKRNGVDIYDGYGEVIDSHTLEVNGEKLKTKNLIIATGASPFIPNIDGLREAIDEDIALTSKEILELKELPKKLIIMGAGVISTEFAILYNTLGVEVTIVQRSNRILGNIDKDIRKTMADIMKRDGIKFLFDTDVLSVDGNSMVIEKDGKKQVLETDKILVSVGNRSNVQDLEHLGLDIDKRGIVTNDKLETNISGIYAIGDVNGKYNLAHMASAEGIVAVENIMGKESTINYNRVPSCIYGFPEVGVAGLTEEEATEQGYDVMVSTFPVSANGKALAEGESDGFIKIVADKKYGEVVGVHIIASHATDMIAEAVLGRKLETTGHEVLKTVHPHPTMSEAVMEAVADAYDEVIHL